MTGAADRNGWRTVLIGASRFSHPDFHDLPAVANNINDLAERLTSPSGGAVAEQHCTVLHNPSMPGQVGTAITQAAAEAEDVLLFYFSGHGKLDQAGNLHLVLPDSDPDQIELSSVPFGVVKRHISKSRAQARIVILDCCFSGNAIETMSTSADLVTFETQNIEGTYVLTSSPKNKPSLAPTDGRHTAFTAALLAAATDTDLTLDQLYASTAKILRGRSQPEPQCRVHNSAHALRLFAPPTTPAAPAVADPVDVDALAVLDAAQQGDVDSMIELAQRFHRAKDLEHAEQWWRLAAEAGNPGAMYNVAVVSEIQRRFEDGKYWYQRAAETGDTNAMHNLAIRLRLSGREAEAARWWHAAGHTSPQRNGEKLRKVVLRKDLPVDPHMRTDDEASQYSLPTTRRLMLITLGKWANRPATWDETPWGGGVHTRTGSGYYHGMSDDELLGSARVFWKFRPANWHGVDFAVVAHAGITRAVIRIHDFIGPFGDRYGIQGQLVDDPDILAELVDKTVPRRQNPITLWA
ncbi:caspase family protein [Nocardia sp. NPDC060249]|uniref:caspase, EACC1-associated type n=1 Tax=Nocardia sp. NPDC060249 TaxID=3347082 RepID=UPI0036620264